MQSARSASDVRGVVLRLDEKEQAVIKDVVKEMKDAYGMIGFWLKGSPIETTLDSWIKRLESLVEKKKS